MRAALLSAFFFGAVCRAQPPAIGQNGVFNAASQIPTTLPGAAIARGARFIVAGVRLGNGAGSVRVFLHSGSHPLAARVLSAEPEHIQALMPDTAPLGPNQIVVETKTGASRPLEVSVTSSAPGLYTENERGWGQGRIDQFDANGRSTPNSVIAPARPGQSVTVLATGLGRLSRIPMIVGGQPSAVDKIERDVEPGVDRLHFRVPLHAPEGCYVPAYARVPGQPPSNVVSMSIASRSGVCGMPGGALVPPVHAQRLGVVGISRSVVLYEDGKPQTTLDEAYAAFLDARRSGDATSPMLLFPPVGTCTVVTGSGRSGVADFSSFPNALLGMLEGRGLTAGSALTVEGTNGKRPIPATGLGSYWIRLGVEEPGLRSARPLFFKTGDYAVTAPGSADIGVFVRTISSPPPFEWSNQAARASIDRTAGTSLNWTVPSSANLMLSLAIGTNSLTTAAAVCLCSSKPQDARIAIPADLLSHFPPTQDLGGRPGNLLFVIAVRLGAGIPPDVRGLDQLWSLSSFARGRRVVYR
jgi:uncharacterized protein (TIGR03437 family)